MGILTNNHQPTIINLSTPQLINDKNDGWLMMTHRIRMYAIYSNIYHQYSPNVSIYIYTIRLDPMGNNEFMDYTTLNTLH